MEIIKSKNWDKVSNEKDWIKAEIKEKEEEGNEKEI